MDSKNKLVITQANSLTEAHYFLTQGEHRLILSMISMIRRHDKDFQEYEFDVPSLAKLWGVSLKNAYVEVHKITKRLLTRVLYLRGDDGSLLMCSWIASAEYKDSKVYLEISKKLKPYLLNLSREYTQFELSAILDFQSAYTVRIYMILRQYRKIGRKEYDLYELREILGIAKTKYPQYRDFRKRVLAQAKKEFEEINKEISNDKQTYYKSDLSFDLETRRTGRKISHLTFIIKPQPTKPTPEANNKPNPQEQPTDNPETHKQNPLYPKLQALKIPEPRIQELFNQHSPDYLQEKLDLTHEEQRKNPAGFFLKACAENYHNPAAEQRAKAEAERQAKEAQKHAERIKAQREKLSHDYEQQAVKDFAASLSRAEENRILGIIAEKYDPEIHGMILKRILQDGVECPMIRESVLGFIPEYEEGKAAYIEAELKKKGDA